MLEHAAPSIRASVVIPVLNEGPRLGECLDALSRQSLPRDAFEVIVVDGGSRDGTRDRVLERGFRFALDEDGCVSSARNRGVSLARGDVVAFTDGDCVPRSDWLARVLERFERSDARVGAVGGGLRIRDHGSWLSRCEDVSVQALYRGFITSNVAYRREALEAVGGFDEGLCCGEDWDLWWRVEDAGWRSVFARDAIVEHAPTEVQAWGSYARRQFWYARNDVRTFGKRVRDVLRSRVPGAEARRAWTLSRVAGPAVAPAFAWAVLAAVPVAPRGALAVAGALVGGQSVVHAAKVCLRVRAAPARGLVGFFVLKYAVRGLGTLTGIADGVVGARARDASEWGADAIEDRVGGTASSPLERVREGSLLPPWLAPETDSAFS